MTIDKQREKLAKTLIVNYIVKLAMKMDSKSYRLDEDKGTESDSCCSGSSSSNVFDYDAMRESLLNTTYSDLGTSAPQEASSKVKAEALNPGLLGKSELKIPVPWGHVQGKSKNYTL